MQDSRTTSFRLHSNTDQTTKPETGLSILKTTKIDKAGHVRTIATRTEMGTLNLMTAHHCSMHAKKERHNPTGLGCLEVRDGTGGETLQTQARSGEVFPVANPLLLAFVPCTMSTTLLQYRIAQGWARIWASTMSWSELPSRIPKI